MVHVHRVIGTVLLILDGEYEFIEAKTEKSEFKQKN